MSSDMDAQLNQMRQELEQERKFRKQAEDRAEQAEDRAEQAENRAEQAEERTRPTTFEELLESCHRLFHPISVQTIKSLSTQGSTTSPKGKCCPTNLQPWPEFPSKNQEAFDTVYTVLHPRNETPLRLFSPLLHIEELGHATMNRKIASEQDLRLFHNIAVENFVARIVSVLVSDPQLSQHLSLGQGVTFENHTNTLSDLAEDVQAHRRSSTPSHQPRHPPNPTYADQICIYKNEDDRMELLFIIEYKAPHKLTKEILRVGLRTMDLPAEVIHRATIPTDPQEKFSYNADRLVASAITQTYSYMLESGVEYSCIITGEAMVFLWIKESDSNTLYYHLMEPNEEVSADAGLGFQHPRTAISQLLSFCLISFQSTRRSQIWRDIAIQRAQTWTVDFEKILRDMPPEERESAPPPSAYKARSFPISVRSPYYLRKKVPRQSSSCSPEHDPHHNRDDPADSSDDGRESVSTPSKRGVSGASIRRGENRRGENRRGENRRRGPQDSSSGGNQHRPYCTQKCLLGLVERSALDVDCPNASLHRQGKKGRTHLLTKKHFCELVRQQLAASLDCNIRELGQQGIRGALFQITLASHGYSFVGKATCDVFVPALRHEGRIYEQLKCIQGRRIPVYLGNIDLDRPWRDLHVRLIHMLLMSWGGERADKLEGVEVPEMEIKQFEDEIGRLGVQHNDLIPANILWNGQNQRIMFIDFEAATAIRRSAVQEVSGNRKRKQGEKKGSGSQARAKARSREAGPDLASW